ncbi:MAG: hypothetical protein JWQ43_2372 [Glaciihabitans sp.]|nr:hypothetical protein [Glaciihabitans sp.]
MTRPLFTLATAMLAASLLVSCAATPGGPTAGASTTATPTGTPGATATPAASASPTPTATEVASSMETPAPAPAPAPATILIGAEALDIVAADGTSLLSVRYKGDGDAAVLAITDVLGDPVRTERAEKTPHYPAVDATIWDGFTVVVNRYNELEQPPEESNYVTNFYVIAEAATTAGGVAIATLDGTRVGDSFADVAADKSDNEVFDDTSFNQHYVTIDLPDSFPGIVPDGDIPMSWGVVGISSPESTEINRIFAPQYLRSLT